MNQVARLLSPQRSNSAWPVHVDTYDEDEVEAGALAMFTGYGAEALAKEYAAWKNGEITTPSKD